MHYRLSTNYLSCFPGGSLRCHSRQPPPIQKSVRKPLSWMTGSWAGIGGPVLEENWTETQGREQVPLLCT